MKATYNKENKIYTDKVSNQLLNGDSVMKKKYIIKTYPIMIKEYLVEADNEEQALDIFYNDTENKVQEYGEMEYSDHEDQILPDVELLEDEEVKEVA
jgi:hypothetical protein